MLWLLLLSHAWSAEVDLRVVAEDFPLSAEAERSARRALLRMFRTYDDVLGLTFPDPTPIHVRLIADRDEYTRQARAIGLNQPTLGFFSTARGEGVVWKNTSPEAMGSTLLHEASHYLMVRGGAVRAPRWLHEGMAVLFGGARTSGNAVYLDPPPGMAAWLAANGPALPSLAALVSEPSRFRGLPATPVGPAEYGVGWSICAFLMTSPRGKTLLAGLLRTSPGASEALIEREWPGGAHALDREWRAWWPHARSIQLPIAAQGAGDPGAVGWVRCANGSLIRQGQGLSCPP